MSCHDRLLIHWSLGADEAHSEWPPVTASLIWSWDQLVNYLKDEAALKNHDAYNRECLQGY